MSAHELPLIIQGGMGVGISHWGLARAVALRGQLGVISGTALDNVFVRRLQDGDIGGHVRRAMANFPIPGCAEMLLRSYFRPEGRNGEPYKPVPMYRQAASKAKQQLTMMAAFVEVWLAREGHDNPVGMNLLTKVQMPNLPTLYGAMLAGVGFVLMGAGIPKEIPGVLDAFANHEPARIRFDVDGLQRDDAEYLSFNPLDYWESAPAPLERPRFLPIVSTDSLATMLARKSNGRVDGFIIEGPTAGGHNAPPRGQPTFNERGEPIYGPRDEADHAKLRDLGLPFWLAGGAGSPEGLQHALAVGAAGIQVGTIFAYSSDSGMAEPFRKAIVRRSKYAPVDVYTDALASPTGFPFKVVDLEGSMAQADVYAARTRTCDLGYLRTAFKREDGRIDYRCPAEPIDTFLKKGGALEETVGRKCLCNALMADIGLGQVRDNGDVERPLITSGDELRSLAVMLAGRDDYSAADVLEYLLAGVTAVARA